MRTFVTLILMIFSLTSCENIYLNIDSELVVKLQKRMSEKQSRRVREIQEAISTLPANEREAFVYLFANMPQADFDTISVELVKKNIKYSFLAREKYEWAANLPLDIFYNDVLPYASMDETRENWRESFYEMFGKVVENSPNAFAAVDTLNKAIKELVGVEYNTKRKKANQSPSESMEIGMASCSGLSILLTDALRSVGIPSRIAGTPLWVTKEGNHNWSEVWIDGEWYFLEYYPEKLNHGWFLPRCAAFEGLTAPEHQVYATSFGKSYDTHFPMVWSEGDSTINGVNVTERYIDIYKKQQLQSQNSSKDRVAVAIKVIKKGGDVKTSGDRVAIAVIVYDSDGVEVASGNSRGANADMNDYLVVDLPQSGKYKIVVDGTTQIFETPQESDKQIEVVLFV